MASRNQKIVKIKGGTKRFRKGGMREVELFCQQFEKEHPNAVRIDGYFRKKTDTVFNCLRDTRIIA